MCLPVPSPLSNLLINFSLIVFFDFLRLYFNFLDVMRVFKTPKTVPTIVSLKRITSSQTLLLPRLLIYWLIMFLRLQVLLLSSSLLSILYLHQYFSWGSCQVKRKVNIYRPWVFTLAPLEHISDSDRAQTQTSYVCNAISCDSSLALSLAVFTGRNETFFHLFIYPFPFICFRWLKYPPC